MLHSCIDAWCAWCLPNIDVETFSHAPTFLVLSSRPMASIRWRCPIRTCCGWRDDVAATATLRGLGMRRHSTRCRRSLSRDPRWRLSSTAHGCEQM